MATVKMEMPEKVFAALRFAPDEFASEMRLAAAASWYELVLKRGYPGHAI